MALEIPVRQFGPRISEEVSTPQINVQKFRSVTDALGQAGGKLRQLGERLKKEQQDAEDSAAVTKAIQQYDLRVTQGMKDLALEMNEEGKNRKTGIGYADDVELMTQNTIEDLSANMPSDRARRIFNERITPKQTKNIIGADVTETATFRNYYNKLNGDVARQRSLGVHSLKSGSVEKAEEYLLENERMFKGGIGKLYDVAGAKANIDQFGNELAFASGEAALRNEDISGLESLLLGSLREMKVKMPGFDPKDLDKRSVSPLEKHLTPAQKNKLLNGLETLYQKKNLDDLNSVGLTRKILDNTVKNGEYQPGNPEHRKMVKTLVDKTFAYRDLKGKPMHYEQALKNFTSAFYNTEVIDQLNKRPFEDGNALAKDLETRATFVDKKIRDAMHTLYGEDLKHIPPDKLKNALDAEIRGAKDVLMKKRDQFLNTNPGGYVVEYDPKLKARIENLNISDPKAVFSADLAGFADESLKKQYAAGTQVQNLNPFPDNFYENVLNEVRRIYQQSDPVSADLTNYVGAFKDSLGPEHFDDFAAKMKELDPKLGGIFAANSGRMRTGDKTPLMARVTNMFHNPELQPALLENLKTKELSIDKLKVMADSEMLPGKVSISPQYGRGFDATIGDISGIKEFSDAKTDIANAATVLISEGVDPEDAITKATESYFEGIQFIEENDSYIFVPRDAPFTAQEMKTFVDRTQNVSDLVNVGMAPNNFDELAKTVPPQIMSGLTNYTKSLVQSDPSRWEGGEIPDFNTPKGQALLKKNVYDIFKNEYVVKWVNSPGGYRSEFVRRDRHMLGAIPSIFGERGTDFNRLAPESFAGFRINKAGEAKEIQVKYNDIGRLLPKIPKKKTEKVFEAIFPTPGRTPQSEPVEIVNPPISMESNMDDIRGMLDEQHQVHSADQEYRPQVKVYESLTEEEMDLYEQDPARYERLESVYK